MSQKHFPYMFWAHGEMGLPTHSLSQSGMPAPAGALLDKLVQDPSHPATQHEAWVRDLTHPCAEIQPALEAALAKAHDVPPERVLVTLGASMAMHMVASLLFRPGVRVAMDVPSYEPFRKLPAYFGAQGLPVWRRADEAWRLAPEDVANALGAPTDQSAAQPTHLFITNPNNPTGATMTLPELRELGALLGTPTKPAQNALIVSEAYMPLSPIQTCAARDIPHAISLGSLTKAYGLGPLRIGFVILGEAWADARETLIDHTYMAYVDPPTVSQRLGLIAMNHLDALLEPYRVFARDCRPVLFQALKDSPFLSGPTSDAGLVAFPRVQPRDGETTANTLELARHLIETEDLSVTPGDHFDAPGHLRLGFGSPLPALTEAVERLKRGLATWHAGATVS